MKKVGFTLIELLVVVIIMSVLTSIAVPQYRKTMDRSKAAEAMQMLPALFESRERWAAEHQCEWSAGSMTDCDTTFSTGKLDIESKGSIDAQTGKITTPNFEYDLIAKGSYTGAQACVSAVPKWGSSRGLAGATIWYRGDKFSCTDGSEGAVCDILNVSDDRTGCH